MIAYRYEAGSSSKVQKTYKKVLSNLGEVSKISGIRWRSVRKNVSNTQERVRIYGENGKCTLDGVCWGYHGQGPRLLEEILIACKVPLILSQIIAFESQRFDQPGTDWELEMDNFSISYNYFKDYHKHNGRLFY
jgi:hypothetical protein